MVDSQQPAEGACSTGDGISGTSAWHAVLQLAHQLHVYRLKLLFDSGNTNIFPKGFAREAVEVGPTDGQCGPCLLLFTFVSLSPQEFTEWQERTCYDWAVLRIFWLPAVEATAAPASGAPAAATGGAVPVRPYACYVGPEGLRQAVRSTPMPPGPDGGCGVRLQVYPRAVEAATAELLRDVVSLDLDTPRYVLLVVQWPSEAVAAAAAALAACDADHARLARGHEKQQKVSQRMVEALQAIADALRAEGAVALSEAEMEAVEAAEAEAGRCAGGKGGEGKEAAACGGEEEEDGEGSGEEAEGSDKRERTKGKQKSGGGGGGDSGSGRGKGGGAAAASVPVVPVVEAVAAIPDPTERWRAATARAALERRRLAEREVRRAGVVARCAEERAGLVAALEAAQGVAEYSFGLLPAAGFYRYGCEREKKMPGQLCRAAGKLREALITCTGSAALPPGLAAVDVGSAPGGWTQQLAAAGAKLVVAVDPAEMDPAVLALPNVRHLQCKCSHAVTSGRLAAALAEAGLARVDLIVCDVNAHPGDAFAMLQPVLELLAPGGQLILTLKTFGRGRDKDSFGSELAARLGEGFEAGRLVWLLNNTLCERTYVARKRAAAA